MRVLVTGGSGFIGTHLVAHLVNCGYEVSNVDCNKPGDERGVELWKNCSILDANTLLAVFLKFQPQFAGSGRGRDGGLVEILLLG